jgi:hypothetical protein
MTIITSLIENSAKAIAGESFNRPTELVVATGVNTTISLTATALDGEIGTRQTLTIVRDVGDINFNVVRSGTDVIDTTSGDSLTAVGMDIAATGNDLQIGVPTVELQTTAFDLELDFDLSYKRS